MFKYHTKRRVTRVGLFLIAVSFILLGAQMLRRGEPDYPNYWGGPVLSIVPIIAGLLAAYVATIGYKRLKKPRSDNRTNRKRREKAPEKSFLDDFDRPWKGGR